MAYGLKACSCHPLIFDHDMGGQRGQIKREYKLKRVYKLQKVKHTLVTV